MALIAMAVYSTPENKKDACLRRTLLSLEDTVDFSKHRLILSVNGATAETERLMRWAKLRGVISDIIINETNIGTAEAINKAWKTRIPGENAVKMDDDVVIHSRNWLYLMEEAISRDPRIGQIGLKRRDCIESPSRPENDFYFTQLEYGPHEQGQIWIPVEYSRHVMGTCVMHSSALLDKVGFLYQPGVYGFDDALMSLRSRLSGFVNCFLVGVDIEHIDDGSTPFQKWKEHEAGLKMAKYNELAEQYKAGKLSLNYTP